VAAMPCTRLIERRGGPTGALLAPAYHCRTMLDPALALGGAFALYLLNADLTPQLVSIKALVAQHSPRITALVVTHYLA
jgi:perosamine synthetase